ncbi:40S ribosomal protein S25 [Ranunculus cassubicifolius]
MAPKKAAAPPPSSKPAKSGGGKQKKKKWSKGKQKEKVNNMVLFDQASYDKLLSEVPKYKLITPSILSDRLRESGNLTKTSKHVRFLSAILIFWLEFYHLSWNLFNLLMVLISAVAKSADKLTPELVMLLRAC